MKILSILIFAISCGLYAPIALATETNSRVVIAHWIVPMEYFKGESVTQLATDDVRAASEAGIDGFAINVFSGEQAKRVLSGYIAAADAVGAKNFKFFLSADMSMGFQAKDIVSTLLMFGRNPHYLQVEGKPLLSTYGGDKFGDAWWSQNILYPLKSAGLPVTFIPYFDRKNPNSDAPSYDNWMSVIKNYPSIDGLFNFLVPGSTPFYSNDSNIGHHWSSTLEADEALANALKDSHKLYMASFMPYYWAACHPAREYVEHQGGRGMDNAWTSIITKQHPELVEIVTWNDYSESTFIQPTRIPSTKTPGLPSLPHLGYYELLKYYISWYHTNHKPLIRKDNVFFFYRTHSDQASITDEYSACHLGAVASRQKWGVVKDDIFITTALTAPADVIVRIGAYKNIYHSPAGLTNMDIPFEPGTPIIELWRNGAKLTSITGQSIVAQPNVSNYNVFSGYSIAGGDNSETWTPTDKWKSGFIADWFSQP